MFDDTLDILFTKAHDSWEVTQ